MFAPRWSVREAARWIRLHELKLRFLAAGGLNTLLGFLVFPSLMLIFGPRGLQYMGAFVIAQVICMSFAYFSQKILVFRTKGNYFREIRQFGTFYIYNFLFGLVMLPLIVEGLHFRPIVAQFILTATVVVTSYFWHSRVTFKPPAPRS